MKQFLLAPAFLLLLISGCSAQKRIAAKDAAKYTGQSVMICDKVYGAEPMTGSNTTLLYLGSATGQYLTVLVKGADDSKFKWHPETDFKGRAVCVSGTVADYKGKPAIYVTTTSQLKLDLGENTRHIPAKQ